MQLHKKKETYQLREGTLHECLDAIREFPKQSSYTNSAPWELEPKGVNKAVTFLLAEIHWVEIILTEESVEEREDLPAKLQGRKVRSLLALQIPWQSRNQKSQNQRDSRIWCC